LVQNETVPNELTLQVITRSTAAKTDSEVISSCGSSRAARQGQQHQTEIEFNFGGKRLVQRFRGHCIACAIQCGVTLVAICSSADDPP